MFFKEPGDRILEPQRVPSPHFARRAALRSLSQTPRLIISDFTITEVPFTSAFPSVSNKITVESLDQSNWFPSQGSRFVLTHRFLADCREMHHNCKCQSKASSMRVHLAATRPSWRPCTFSCLFIQHLSFLGGWRRSNQANVSPLARKAAG